VELGKRLDWPVYDREILDLISKQSGLRTELLATIDEHDPHWLQETITSFGHPGELSSAGYAKHLKRVLATLATHGNCILVGRGATALLPPQTTLRIRIVEPLKTRTARIARQYHLSGKDAEKRTRQIDLERVQFIENHFRISINDPHGFDLTLNTALLSPSQCADLILPLVGMRQQLLVQAKSKYADTREVDL
jgi:cytidylate kinase